jgi:ComF family protein
MGETQALRAALRQTADALMTAVLAPRCAACGSALEAPLAGCVCAPCWGRVHAQAMPFRLRSGFVDSGCAAGSYEGTLREIIHAFKYDGRRSLARPLGAMLRHAGVDMLRDADCVVPVPLHAWRRVRRGFNQASDLARQLELPVLHALWRTRWTPPQTGLTAGGRRRNVRRAFQISPLLSRGRYSSLFEDRIVVLVDDVRTTGATLNECARVLKRAGALEVRALTVAVAAPPGTQPHLGS